MATSDPRPTLSVCLRCRDGRERNDEDRGGARFARAVGAAFAARHAMLHEVALRGVRCMSQCKRPCTVALSAPDRFTYLFGDLDPHRDAHAVVDLLSLYLVEPLGFMPRDRRPPPFRAGILGRIPPLEPTSDLVEPLPLLEQDQDAS